MSKDEYLITDAPLKALTVFAMPMILGSFFQQIYNMADSIIVGQFVGSSALAAVGACAANSVPYRPILCPSWQPLEREPPKSQGRSRSYGHK